MYSLIVIINVFKDTRNIPIFKTSDTDCRAIVVFSEADRSFAMAYEAVPDPEMFDRRHRHRKVRLVRLGYVG